MNSSTDDLVALDRIVPMSPEQIGLKHIERIEIRKAIGQHLAQGRVAIQELRVAGDNRKPMQTSTMLLLNGSKNVLTYTICLGEARIPPREGKI